MRPTAELLDHNAPMQPLATVAIVTYMSARHVEGYIRSAAEIVERSSHEIELKIVDNSPDSSDAAILKDLESLERVGIKCCPDNPGFAASCNYMAQESTARWIIFVNPDIDLSSADFSHVLNILADYQETATFAVGQITHDVYHQGIALLGGIWFADRSKRSQKKPLGPSGGFGIYPRDCFNNLGGYDSSLFAWGEDAELAMRIRSAGVPCVPINEFFAHSGGHSIEGNAALKARKSYLLYRNRVAVARRHYGVIRFTAFAIAMLVRLSALVPRCLRLRQARAAFKGAYDGMFKEGAAIPGSLL